MARKSGLVMAEQPAERRTPTMASDIPQAWRWVGWFGLMLAVASISDWTLAWVPVHLGNPEWEFGTVASSIAGLPLMAMGFAALLSSALARGIRWQVITMGWVLVAWSVLLLAALGIFLLDVPLALRTTQGAARIGIIKATAKTAILGLVFITTYGMAGIQALRHTGRRERSA